MLIDFEKFCLDYKIDIAPKRHQHSRKGWINVGCPLCASSHKSFHLGYNQREGYFKCYRCGWHPTEKIIAAFARVTADNQLYEIIKEYKGRSSYTPQDISVIRPENITLPTGTQIMTERHKKYLRERNFDPDKLEREYGLLGTGPDGDYRWRIIAPIYFNRRLVSYQGRDITGQQFAKYKGCKDELEVIPHKNILYGWDQIPYHSEKCMVVEGITGVWRLGPGSLATFGVEYTTYQLRLLASRFKDIYLLFDPDQAGEKAEKITDELMALGKDAHVLEITIPEFDSGNISQELADELMKKYIK